MSDAEDTAPTRAPARDPTRGMVEIRHVPGGTRAAYNEIYHDVGIRHPDALWRRLLDLVDARPGMRLLDVACGEGQLLRLAIGRGIEAHGVDLSEVALAKARAEAPRAVLAVANGETLPYPDGWFDRVSNMGSLEHYEDPVRGVAEMARVCRPDGKVVLHVPNAFGLRWNVLHAWRHGDVHDDGQPIQRYGTRAQWARVLAAGGLAVERVVGYDEAGAWPAGRAEYVGLVRHPSRLLGPVTPFLPPDMASIFVFVCRRGDRWTITGRDSDALPHL
jgi:SAM-dependent methyltransferase